MLSAPMHVVSPAICNQGCANGGSCTSPGVCKCASGWSGSGCTDRKLLILYVFKVYNQNFTKKSTIHACMYCSICFVNIISAHHLKDMCVACEFVINSVLFHTAVCSPSCSNGGTCTAPNTCSCTPQWTGATCTDG